LDFYNDDDDVFDHGVGELERRADLERTRAQGVRVEVELTEDTPFRRYVLARRAGAIEAMARITVADPADQVAVLREQHIIQEYLRVRNWARSEIEASIEADTHLQEGNRGSND
tara:strand:- start:1060 stop:1401 length:342 start_codon:yes stop_codon:yes gene_type:complete